jgi:hypothetical protein
VLHSRRFQLGQVGAREPPAPDLVVEEEDVDSPLRELDHRAFEAPPEPVVANDIELHQRVPKGAFQAVEDAGKGRLTVHEELDFVPEKEGAPRDLLQCLVVRKPVEAPNHVRSESLVNLHLEGIDLFSLVLPGLEVALELAATEHPVQRNREIGKGVQAQAPGDRALCRAIGQNRVERGEKPQHMGQDQKQRHHPRPLSTDGSACLSPRRPDDPGEQKAGNEAANVREIGDAALGARRGCTHLHRALATNQTASTSQAGTQTAS